MEIPPLARDWLRSNYILQPGQRTGKDNVNEEQQILVIQRWLGELKNIQKDHDLDFTEEAGIHAAQKKLTEPLRRRFRDVAVKFHIGAVAAQQKTSRNYLEDPGLLRQFERGDLDNLIYNTQDPANYAPFWPFIKEVDEAAKKATAKAAADGQLAKASEFESAAQELIEEGQQQEQAQSDAAAEITGTAKQKRLEAFYLQLKAYAMKFSVALPEVMAEVDQILAQRGERKKLAAVAASDRNLLQWVNSPIVDPSTSEALRRDTPGPQPSVFMLLDCALAPVKEGEVLSALMNVPADGAIALLHYHRAETTAQEPSTMKGESTYAPGGRPGRLGFVRASWPPGFLETFLDS